MDQRFRGAGCGTDPPTMDLQNIRNLNTGAEASEAKNSRYGVTPVESQKEQQKYMYKVIKSRDFVSQ